MGRVEKTVTVAMYAFAVLATAYAAVGSIRAIRHENALPANRKAHWHDAMLQGPAREASLISATVGEYGIQFLPEANRPFAPAAIKALPTDQVALCRECKITTREDDMLSRRDRLWLTWGDGPVMIRGLMVVVGASR